MLEVTKSNTPDFDPKLEEFLDELGAAPGLEPEPPDPNPNPSPLALVEGAQMAEDADPECYDPWERFASGVTAVAGPPELRTRLFCDIAARLSAGADTLAGEPHTFEGEPLPWNVLVVTQRPEAFARQVRAFGGDLSRVKFLREIRLPEQFALLRQTVDSQLIAVTIFDPVYPAAGPGALNTEQKVAAFIEGLRKAVQGRRVLIGLNSSHRKAQAGAAAWERCDISWHTEGDTATQRLVSLVDQTSWEFTVTPEGLRDGHTDVVAAASRKSYAAGVAEGWLLAMTADGQKHAKSVLVDEAARVGITKRQLESAFAAIPGMKYERAAAAPPVTMWWREGQQPPEPARQF